MNYKQKFRYRFFKVNRNHDSYFTNQNSISHFIWKSRFVKKIRSKIRTPSCQLSFSRGNIPLSLSEKYKIIVDYLSYFSPLSPAGIQVYRSIISLICVTPCSGLSSYTVQYCIVYIHWSDLSHLYWSDKVIRRKKMTLYLTTHIRYMQ